MDTLEATRLATTSNLIRIAAYREHNPPVRVSWQKKKKKKKKKKIK